MVMEGPAVKARKGKKKIPVIYYIGGVGAAIVVYVAYSRAKANAGTATTTDTTTDPSIDPSTGIPYADEDYSGTGATGVTPSLYSYEDPSTGANITLGTSGAPTNASWAQEAESYLEGLGYDPQTVGAALGTYITGGGLSTDQLSLVQEALAFQGNAPNPLPAPQLAAPTGQTQPQSSANNANIATLRAQYDTTLATVRNASLKLSPAQIAALRTQLGQQGAAYQAALAQANLAQQKS